MAGIGRGPVQYLNAFVEWNFAVCVTPKTVMSLLRDITTLLMT